MRKMLMCLLLLATMAHGQEIPTKNPSEVWVKGRKLDHSWRDGRIWIQTSELQPLLNMSSPYASMDLLKSLEAKGGYSWKIENGNFVARPDQSVTRSPGSSSPAARPQTREIPSATRRAPARAGSGAAVGAGKLTYQVKQFEADTGYMRAWVLVTNTGAAPNDPSEMICQFQDGFGKTFATHRTVIGPLQPGESQVFETFSSVLNRDTSMTATSDNVAVNFFSLTNPSANPQTAKQARQQAKAGKKKSGLDFNKGWGNINPAQTTKPIPGMGGSPR